MHTHFNGDPLSTLTASVTELVYMTPQDDVSLEELNDVLVRSHKLLEGHKDLSVGGVIGTMEERPDQLVAVVGWESVEVR